MANPFRKFGTAFKIGYRVFQRYETLAAAGLVPNLPPLHNVPVSVIDDATKAFVKTIKDAHSGPTQPAA